VASRLLYSVDVRSGLATRIVIPSIPGPEIVGGVWSPDQTQILFKRLTDVIDLYVMNADGSGVHQITSDPNDDRYIDWGTHPLEP
jgi:Tol biopolymer transport system component